MSDPILQLGSITVNSFIPLEITDKNKNNYLQSAIKQKRIEEIVLNNHHPIFIKWNNRNIGDVFYIFFNLSGLCNTISETYNLNKQQAFSILKFRQIRCVVFSKSHNKHIFLKLYRRNLDTKQWIECGKAMWSKGNLTINNMSLDFNFVGNNNQIRYILLYIQGELNINTINHFYEGQLIANEGFSITRGTLGGASFNAAASDQNQIITFALEQQLGLTDAQAASLQEQGVTVGELQEGAHDWNEFCSIFGLENDGAM